jgi:hypothetical protein
MENDLMSILYPVYDVKVKISMITTFILGYHMEYLPGLFFNLIAKDEGDFSVVHLLPYFQLELRYTLVHIHLGGLTWLSIPTRTPYILGRYLQSLIQSDNRRS